MKFNRGKLATATRDYRGDKDLRTASNEAGVSASTLSRVENASESALNVETLSAICTWMDVSPSVFFDGESSPHREYSQMLLLESALRNVINREAADAIMRIIREMTISPSPPTD